MSCHNNKKRTLVEYGIGNYWKVGKVIVMHEDAVLGNHYHKLKDETFMLVYGSGKIGINGVFDEMQLFREYKVVKNDLHTFELKKGSILAGLCSELFNENDDYNG